MVSRRTEFVITTAIRVGARLARGAKERITDRFSLDRMIKRYKKLYLDLASEKNLVFP